MAAGAAAAIGGNLIGGYMADKRAGKDRDAANAARNNALAQFAGLVVPDIEDQEVFYEMLQSAGDLNPIQEQYVGDAISQVENLDPRLQQAQLQALSQMSGIAEAGGLTAADYAAQRELAREVEGAAKARDASIIQNMAERGVGGSGMELAARLRGAQGASERMSREDDQLLSQALGRQMQAAQFASQMAGQGRGQNLNEAQAMDAIQKFNLANQQRLQGANVDRSNQAQQFNLANNQRIADTNVGARNMQQDRNKGLIQQQYQNQAQRASGMAGQYQGQAGAADQRAGQTASMWAGIGQGIGEIGASAFDNKDKDKG